MVVVVVGLKMAVWGDPQGICAVGFCGCCRGKERGSAGCCSLSAYF